jgi:adhesin transport system membrane fusion protein
MKLKSWFGRLNAAERIIFFSAIGLSLFILWASLAQVDEVTRGQGRVIPSSKVQLVQAAEPSTIEEILVRSGQTVKKGQLLVRFDDTTSSSELGQLQTETERLTASSARLNREAGGTGGCVGASCIDEQRLQQARQSAQRSRVSALSAGVEQRRRDLGEAQATVASLESSLKLAQDQLNMLRPFTAQREMVDIRGRLDAARQGISRASAAIREAQAQVSESQFQYRQDALNERSQINTKIAVNEQTMRGAQGRLNRAEIRSPVNGIVNDVQVTTVGGFLNAGEKIMQIVPMGDKLLIEARVAPGDIAFIKVGDRANIKVTAYDFSIYGGLSGRVAQVSADSIYDEVERQAYFTVIVETDRSFLLKGGKHLPITPGMICDVEIMTGRKSVLSYLLKPVLKARSEALTER